MIHGLLGVFFFFANSPKPQFWKLRPNNVWFSCDMSIDFAVGHRQKLVKPIFGMLAYNLTKVCFIYIYILDKIAPLLGRHVIVRQHDFMTLFTVWSCGVV